MSGVPDAAAAVPPSVQELGETVRALKARLYAALKHEKSCTCGNCSGGLNAVDDLATLAAQAELQEELEEERTAPDGWGPAQEEWHQFHLDQTKAAEARAVAAEKELGKWKRVADGIERACQAAEKERDAIQAKFDHLHSEYGYESFRGDHLVYHHEWQEFDQWQRVGRKLAHRMADQIDELCEQRIERNAERKRLAADLDEARAQVAALKDALSDLLADDDMPNHWEDCVCSYCTKNRAARAALAGSPANTDNNE